MIVQLLVSTVYRSLMSARGFCTRDLKVWNHSRWDDGDPSMKSRAELFSHVYCQEAAISSMDNDCADVMDAKTCWIQLCFWSRYWGRYCHWCRRWQTIQSLRLCKCFFCVSFIELRVLSVLIVPDFWHEPCAIIHLYCTLQCSGILGNHPLFKGGSGMSSIGWGEWNRRVPRCERSIHECRVSTFRQEMRQRFDVALKCVTSRLKSKARYDQNRKSDMKFDEGYIVWAWTLIDRLRTIFTIAPAEHNVIGFSANKECSDHRP